MNALFVAALPPERSSMVGRILPLARATARAGHQVRLLTLSGRAAPPFTETRMVDGVSLRVVGPNLRATSNTAPDAVTTWRRFRAGRAALARTLAALPADVVVLAKPQLQNTPPVLDALATRPYPLVLDVDDLEGTASRLPLPLGWYASWLEHRALRRAVAITACSPFLAEYARRVNPRATVEFLPTGIDLPASVPPARLRDRLRLPGGAKIILYVGSLSVASGHRVDALVDAFARLLTLDALPEAHLVLAGTGLDAERLRARAGDDLPLSTRVHFLGRFTPPEDLALAREANLLVDPVDRTAANEAKSSHRVLLALATGTPVVAGNVGIRSFLLPPILHADCLYEPNDPNALWRALTRGLDPALGDRFPRATAGLIENRTWHTIGPHFVHLLESVARTSA